MIKTAIVEDSAVDAEILNGFLIRYGKENGYEFDIRIFSDALKFLFEYKPDFELVFMDIDLPGLAGNDAALKLRETDPVVPLVFTTSLAQYASEGYKAGAIDYLVKPYTYAALSFAMKSVVPIIRRRAFGHIVVRNLDGYKKIPIDSLLYVEVKKHRLFYHTDSDVIDVWGSMPSVESELMSYGFTRCGASFLVNLKRIKFVKGNEVTVGKDVLKISRTMKKEFIAALHAYIAGNGVK